MVTNYEDSIIFNFLGNTIKIPKERDIYNSIRLKFQNNIINTKENFIEIYKSENKNIDDVSAKALNQGNSIIYSVISQTVSEIVDLGFYNIDEDIFIEEYYSKYYDYEDYYNEVNDKYMEIVLTEEQKDEYRKARRENRSKWQGGGFGISGALKGAAEAGMINMASGAVHGMFNIGGKIISSIGASMKKNSLFNDDNTLETLVLGIQSSVYGIELAYIDFLNDNYENKIPVILEKDEKQAEVIFNNILNRNLDFNTEINLFKNIIDLDPYNFDYYAYMISKYGDSNNEISKMAYYFGYDLLGYKQEIINKAFNQLNMDTEKNTLQAKKEITKMINDLGLNCESDDRVNYINQKLNEFDKEARTIDGILFANREKADKARNQIEEIKDILNNMDKNNMSSIKEAKIKILGINAEPELTNKYIKLLSKEIDELDIRRRTYDGVIYESIELKREAEQKGIIEGILKKVDKNSEESLKEVKNEINYLDMNENIKKEYIDKINEMLEKLDIKLRTFNNITYATREEKEDIEGRTFNGVLYNTVTEADEARIKQIDIDKRTYNGRTYKTESDVEKAKIKDEHKNRKHKKNQQREENTIYKFFTKLMKILYYIIFSFCLLITVCAPNRLNAIGLLIIPIVFIGLVFGVFKIEIMKNQNIIIKLLSIAGVTIVSWVITV